MESSVHAVQQTHTLFKLRMSTSLPFSLHSLLLKATPCRNTQLLTCVHAALCAVHTNAPDCLVPWLQH